MGEVVNFVQVDAFKIQNSAFNISYLTSYPLVIITCFVFLFYYLGISFFSGVGIFVIAFVINLVLTKISAKLQKKYMECQD
jgi:hypothetical protein